MSANPLDARHSRLTTAARRCALLLAALLLASAARAQGHVGNSPFVPPDKNDITFVVDQAPGLDTGCTFRGGGPLVFAIKTTRFVGETNADGTLKNAAQLVANGVISATAKLSLPGFDVDYDATPPPPFNPERDQLLFNGQPVDFLRGVNNAWIMNSFEIPIERVKFPARGANGQLPTPAENTIVVNIDVANADEVWCTAVDWASLTIKALSPVILVHGNNSAGAFFDRQGFTTTLRNRRIPFDNSIAMPTETIAEHSAKLDSLIPAIVKSFGTDSVHLVAHSKGGLDSRDYLANYQAAHDKDFKVLSLTTLSTPHNGSVLADLKVEYDAAAAVTSHINFPGFPGITEKVLAASTIDDGTTNLTTGFVSAFNAANLPRLPAAVAFNTVAADADTNGNGEIDFSPDEYAALRAESAALADLHASTFGTTKSRWVVDAMYQILRRTASVNVTYKTTSILGLTSYTTATVNQVVTGSALGNDTLVTLPSGRGDGSIAARVTNKTEFTGAAGRNHSNVANAGVASTVLPWLFSIERSAGDLR